MAGTSAQALKHIGYILDHYNQTDKSRRFWFTINLGNYLQSDDPNVRRCAKDACKTLKIKV